jgi:hypothetical protein
MAGAGVRGCAFSAMKRTAARRERRPNSNSSWQSAAADGPANDESPALECPGGTGGPLAYVFRALGLLKVHRRGRRKAVGLEIGWRPLGARAPSLFDNTRAAMQRDRKRLSKAVENAADA